MGNRSPDRVAAVRRMVAAHLPGNRVDSVVPVGEGTDHLAFEVNGELIVRWSKEPVEAFLEAHRPPRNGRRCSPTTISGSSMSWSTRAPGR